ncbi:hypothetical protein KR074_005949 [Drosophila pseudoananassae]|nr:hypothetical protein KR074_005949 [Drosophila pseudoananassae]
MDFRLAISGLLTILLAYFRAEAILWPDQHPQEERMALQLAGTLKSILINSFAVNDLSLCIFPVYDQMSPDEVSLVHRILGLSLSSLHMPVPIVLSPRIEREIRVQIFSRLLFVTRMEQVISIASSWEENPLFLIVWLTPPPKLELAQKMSYVFRYFLHERYNINSLILVPGVLGVQAYHVWPYTPQSCASTTPVEVSLSDTTLYHLYPSRFKNLHRCPLSAIVWEIPPYMGVKWKEGKVTGLDGVILHILSTKMNFTLELLRNEPSDLIGGASFLNGTFTGPYKMLLERRANFTIGCASCTPERSAFLKSTAPYSQMAYVIVMKAPERYSIYEVMLFPFARYTWMALVLVYLCHRLLGIRWRLPGPFLAGWMLWIFVIRASYEASIFNFLHNSPGKPLPHTLEQMLGHGYRFITDHATFRMTLKLPDFRDRTAISKGQPVDVFDALLKERSQKIGALTSRAFLAYHLTKKKKRRHRFVILAEKIVDNMLCMYFPKNSYFAWDLDRQLFKMRSFGLLQHHSQRLAWSNMPTTSDAHGWSSSTGGEEEDAATGFAESMGFILAALNCLVGALGFSILVFGLELLSRRRRWQRLAELMERI